MQPGGAAALLSSVQRKGEGSPAQSRGTSRKRMRLPTKVAPLSDLRSPLRARPSGGNSRDFGCNCSGPGPAWFPSGPDSADRLLHGTSGAADPQEGTTLADVPTVDGAPCTLTHARARRAPARDGLQEDEIWKVMIYSVD